MDLIEGRVKNSSVIEEKVKSLNLGLKKFITVITVDIKEFDVANFSIPYLRDYLERMIAGSKALIYSDTITMVNSYGGEREIFESDAGRLRDFLKEYKLHAGLSRPFAKLEDLGEHYAQSLEALSLGMRIDGDVTIYAYDDYAIYHIAKVCAEASDLKKLCHPKLEYLMEYDAEHKTSFTESFYTYLTHSPQHHQHGQGATPAPQLHDLSPEAHRGNPEFQPVGQRNAPAHGALLQADGVR